MRIKPPTGRQQISGMNRVDLDHGSNKKIFGLIAIKDLSR